MWKQDCPEYKDVDDELEKTPKGGLILHWMSAVIIIAVISGVKDKADMMAFPGVLQTYAHSLLLCTPYPTPNLEHISADIFSAVFITFGLARLRGRAEALGRQDVGFKWMWKANGPLKWIIAAVLCLYALFNLFMMVSYPITPYTGKLPNWATPAVVLSVALIGVLYFFLFFWGSTFADQGMENEVEKERFSMLKYAGIQCIVSKVDRFKPELDEKARRFGSRRTVVYQVSATGFKQSSASLPFGLALQEDECAVLALWRNTRGYYPFRYSCMVVA